MRIFGGERIQGLMERFDLPEDHPIQNKMVSGALVQAQSKVEGFNFDSRKHLLDYDDIINKQRLTFYDRRHKILVALDTEDGVYIRQFVEDNFERQLEGLRAVDMPEDRKKGVLKEIGAPVEDLEKVGELAKIYIEKFEGIQVLGIQIVGIMDLLWMNHLENIEALRESVRIRAYGQRDPLIEYRRESKMLFDDLEKNLAGWVFAHLFKLKAEKTEEGQTAIKLDVANSKVGRNDPCPCGSGKKYKKCHGK